MPDVRRVRELRNVGQWASALLASPAIALEDTLPGWLERVAACPRQQPMLRTTALG